jgi:hypothetical protein
VAKIMEKQQDMTQKKEPSDNEQKNSDYTPNSDSVDYGTSTKMFSKFQHDFSQTVKLQMQELVAKQKVELKDNFTSRIDGLAKLVERLR